MEEPAVQQEKTEGSQERRDDGGKADWKNECSLSTLLKHSCFLCWSSPRDTDVMETDDRVVAKGAEIRELENAVTVESLELQEQQSDRKELEETLDKLEKHKETLVEQIKSTRQLCYEESQQILSLQAEEAQKESQVEEYERELARARWRLKRLREEVKQAKRKVEEAGERDTPLQDSIKQSYEEILQEENTLCSLSGGVVTPESQLEESASPADTTEDDPLPMRPWGRSQSLPAYADLIMGANGLSFCNNLAGTREEDDSGTSSPKDMDRSDIEEDPEDGDVHNDGDKAVGQEEPDAVGQMDFFQDNPFTLGQTDHDLFNEDLFPKTDSSDGFASDPFKGSNPFAADVLFPDGEGGNADEAETSLSCAENKASTGTQCFESEFPDEDSDIEISYSREDLDAMATGPDCRGFKPIQSSSEDLGPELLQAWRSQGQHSVESDPNGYELDLGAVSPPSDVEEHSLGSLAEEAVTTVTGLQQGLTPAVPQHGDQVWLEAAGVEPGLPPTREAEWVGVVEKEARGPATPQNSLEYQNLVDKPDSSQHSFDLSYEASGPSSCDPYGFKLSPEHSSHTLLDPDEAELSPEPEPHTLLDLDEAELSPEPEPHTLLDPDEAELSPEPEPHTLLDPDEAELSPEPEPEPHTLLDPDEAELSPEPEPEPHILLDPDEAELSPEPEPHILLDLDEAELSPEPAGTVFDPEPSSSLDFDPFGFEVAASDPYGFKLSGEEENQEVLDRCEHENQEVLELFDSNFQELPDGGNQETLEPSELFYKENQELLDFGSHDNRETADLGGDEVLEPFNCENLEVLDFHRHGNQEVLGFDRLGNQELLGFDHHGNQELLGFCSKENQEVVASDNQDNRELQELGALVDICSHGNQEVPDPPSKPDNNQHVSDPYSSTNSSSDSDLASEYQERPELRAAATTNPPNMAAAFHISSAPKRPGLLDDLGSVFGAGGYVGCPDVADDLEPLGRKQGNPVAEPPRPVRPPRPSLRNKDKAVSRGIDLK